MLNRSVPLLDPRLGKRVHAHGRRILTRWKALLLLTDWKIDVTYHDDDSAVESVVSADGACCVARTTAQWPYRQALIEVNIPAAARLDDEDFERVLVHELCHLLVRPMHVGTDEAVDREEWTVTGLQRTLFHVATHFHAKGTREASRARRTRR